VGALCASFLSNVWLKPILLVVMVMVAISLLLPKTIATKAIVTSSADQRLGLAGWLSLFGAGLYGGFIQAGVGFILVAVLSGVLQYDLVRSNALKLVCTGVFSGVALLIFAAQGQVLWVTGGILALGSMLGAWASVRVTIRLSETVLRRILVIMVATSCLAALLV
jgi:hypothetical protein